MWLFRKNRTLVSSFFNALFPVLPHQLLVQPASLAAARGSRIAQIPSGTPFQWTVLSSLEELTCKAAITGLDVELIQCESLFSRSICWRYFDAFSKLEGCLRWYITVGGITRLSKNLERKSWRMGLCKGLWKLWCVPENLEGPCVGSSSCSGEIWDGPDYRSHSWLMVGFCGSGRWRPREYCSSPRCVPKVCPSTQSPVTHGF